MTRVVELDWWQEHEQRGVRFVVRRRPSTSRSARSGTANRRLWASWASRAASGGSTSAATPATSTASRRTGARLGPFDVAALPIGAYRPAEIMKWVHTTPEQAVQAFVDLDARTMLGMHWGTFDLADEPLDEPPGAHARRHRAARDRPGPRLDPQDRGDAPW